MLSNQLTALLRPYKGLLNKHALSPMYRVLELSEGLVVGCSPAIILETQADHGVKETCHVEAAPFLAVLESLPAGKEVELRRLETTLEWKCGNAKGKLALLAIEPLPQIPTIFPARRGWAPTAEFAKALRLGGMSCDNTALMSMGLYGIVIDRENDMIYSTDNTTISLCEFDPEGMEKIFPPQMTFTPEVVELLASTMLPGKSHIQYAEQSILYADEVCRLYAKEVPPLKGSALEIFCGFADDSIKAKISPEAIGAFVKRAAAMAESRKQSSISLGASEGKLELIFAEGSAATDEMFLVEGPKIPDMAPISLDGQKLARALAHIDTVVMDHMARQVVVLTGNGFSYLLSGSAARK